jgi:hypothetical protein
MHLTAMLLSRIQFDLFDWIVAYPKQFERGS